MKRFTCRNHANRAIARLAGSRYMEEQCEVSCEGYWHLALRAHCH